jgi:hypothetical protein
MNKINPASLFNWLNLNKEFRECGCGAVKCPQLSKSASCSKPTDCIAIVYAEWKPQSKVLLNLLEEEWKS